jgi:hypothetical protein
MGPLRCPETSVNSYHTTPRNIPEELRSHKHRVGSFKSRAHTLRTVNIKRPPKPEYLQGNLNSHPEELLYYLNPNHFNDVVLNLFYDIY